jgi:hypothetical protein
MHLFYPDNVITHDRLRLLIPDYETDTGNTSVAQHSAGWVFLQGHLSSLDTGHLIELRSRCP